MKFSEKVLGLQSERSIVVSEECGDICAFEITVND